MEGNPLTHPQTTLPTLHPYKFTSSSSSRASLSRCFSANSSSSLAIRSLDLLRARSLSNFASERLRASSSSSRASLSRDRLRRKACSTLMSRSSFSMGVRGRNPYLSLRVGRYNRGLGERDRRIRLRSSREPVRAATSASETVTWLVYTYRLSQKLLLNYQYIYQGFRSVLHIPSSSLRNCLGETRGRGSSSSREDVCKRFDKYTVSIPGSTIPKSKFYENES